MRRLFLLYGFFFIYSNVFAQVVAYQNSVQDFITKSTPQAYQFQKYGDMPVNTNTGTVDVNIPLFSVGIKNVDWNVSIGYHTGGVKVNEISGCVGLGWNLNAAGMISSRNYQRSDVFMRNMGDSTAYRRYFNLTPNSPVTGEIFNCNYANPTDIGIADNIVEMKANGSGMNYIPDVFYLNANSLSCKFFLKPDHQGYCLPSKDIKIEHFPGSNVDEVSDNTKPGYWIVTDEKGTKYRFEWGGGNSSETMYPNNTPDTSGGTSPLAFNTYNPTFVLTRIENTTGEKIWLYYTKEYYFYKGNDVHQYHLNDASQMEAACNNPINGFLSPAEKSVYNYVVESRIDSIFSSKGESIIFTYSARQDLYGSSKLNRIAKYFRSGSGYQFIKAFDLANGYFGTGTSCRDLRLKLLNVTEKDVSNQAGPGYSFVYDSTLLPSRISPAQDSAGFYNGQTSNTNLVPVYGGNRTYSFTHTKACTLEKVNYPTGGYTYLEYELKQNGGLRVKRKTDYTNDKGYSIKDYEYSNMYAVTGTTAQHIFSKEKLNHQLHCVNPSTGSPVQLFCPSIETYSQPYSTLYESFYGIENMERYGVVNEYYGTGGVSGKVEYKYGQTGLNPPTGFFGAEDLLTEKNTYKKVDTGFVLFDKEITSYALLNDTANFFNNASNSREVRTWGIDFELEKEELNGNCNPNNYCFPKQLFQQTLFFMSSPLLVNIQKSIVYADGVILENKKTFNYDVIKNLLPKSITTYDSSKGRIMEVVKYPTDFSGITASDAISVGVNSLKVKHVISEPVEKSTYRLNLDSTNSRLISSSFISFHSSLPVMSKIYAIENSTGLTGFTPSSVSGGAIVKDALYKERVLFNAYNGFGDITEIQKKDDVKSNYIWDEWVTDSGSFRFPVASVINADISSIAYSSFEATSKGGWTFSGSTSASYYITGNKSYNTGGGNITKSGLTSTTYIVSYWGRNGSVNVNSAGPTRTGKTIGDWTYYEHEVTTTSITVSGSNYIDELRLYPKGARMTTYTYTPLVGMTSQCDATNRMLFYEYDSFNRLKLVKDEDGRILKKVEYKYQGTYQD